MFIIWGSKSTEKVITTINKNFKCEHCNNVAPFHIKKYVDWFTLYFIPLIPLHTVYRTECSICSYGFEIEKKRVQEILEEIKE